MKKQFLISIAVLFTLFSSCSKNDFLNGGGFGTTKPGLPDEFFTISAKPISFDNSSRGYTEKEGTITIPTGKQVTLSVSEIHRKIKDITWKVNGAAVANGNNVTATLSFFGAGKLTIDFTEIESGTKHSKELKLYGYKTIYISVSITPSIPVCGKVAFGLTQILHSYNNDKIGPYYEKTSVQNICTTGSANTAHIARLPINIYSTNTSLSLDLIEPKETTTSSSSGIFCFLFFCFGSSGSTTVLTPLQVYQTDTFSPVETSNLKAGTYTKGNVTLTIEE